VLTSKLARTTCFPRLKKLNDDIKVRDDSCLTEYIRLKPFKMELNSGTTETDVLDSSSDITDIGWKTSDTVLPPQVEVTDILAKKAGIKMRFNNGSITVDLPYVDADIRFLKTLREIKRYSTVLLLIISRTKPRSSIDYFKREIIMTRKTIVCGKSRLIYYPNFQRIISPSCVRIQTF